MNLQNLYRAIQAEIIKNARVPIIKYSFLLFSLGPLMGGFLMILLGNPDMVSDSSPLLIKSELLSIKFNWNSYLRVQSQMLGVGGIIIFGFCAAWQFGREYSDRTIKELVSMPIPIQTMLNAKFLIYAAWCVLLALSNFMIALVIGYLINLPEFNIQDFLQNLRLYLFILLLTISISIPTAFFAVWGRGYLSPIAFVCLMLIFSQILASLGLGHYFPWSVPALKSGTAASFGNDINVISYLMVGLVAVSGYIMTIYRVSNSEDYE